jgi:Mycotoxin biosynthesis protein UstYa
MCRGDTTLVGYYWRRGLPVSHVNSVRECVNWEKLDSWARSRMVDMSDLSAFVPLEPSN